MVLVRSNFAIMQLLLLLLLEQTRLCYVTLRTVDGVVVPEKGWGGFQSLWILALKRCKVKMSPYLFFLSNNNSRL